MEWWRTFDAVPRPSKNRVDVVRRYLGLDFVRTGELAGLDQNLRNSWCRFRSTLAPATRQAHLPLAMWRSDRSHSMVSPVLAKLHSLTLGSLTAPRSQFP